MKLSTRITFFNNREIILIMDQLETYRGKVLQYEFRLFNSEGGRLGSLDYSLTKGYGYNGAIGLVGRALLPLFPELQLEINPVRIGVTPFKWDTKGIQEVIRQLDEEMLSRPHST